MCACFVVPLGVVCHGQHPGDVLVGQDRLQQFADEQDLCPAAMDPSKTHTFYQTILLPEPIRRGKKAKTRPRPEIVKQPARKAQKAKEPPKLYTKPSLKKQKPDHSPQPDENRRETSSSGPATQEAKLLQRRGYEQARNRTPERREYHRRRAQEERQKARETGKCRNCSKPAILGETRCPDCAEAHRQSRRRSDDKRRAAATGNPPSVPGGTTGQAGQPGENGV